MAGVQGQHSQASNLAWDVPQPVCQLTLKKLLTTLDKGAFVCYIITMTVERDRMQEQRRETRTHLGEVQAASDTRGQSFFADAQAEFGTAEERLAQRDAEESA